MRRLPVMLILATASSVLATPAAAPPPVTWADWVGDWSGKLKWTSCTLDGADRAALALDATDGVVSIDLSPAGVALGRMSLIEDVGGWTGKNGDVTVRVSHAKAASTKRQEASELADALDSTKSTKREEATELADALDSAKTKPSSKRVIADALEVSVDLDSGCQMRGTLLRASTGILSCDRLAAWARIESQCTKLTRPPLENPARLARQREQWAKVRGEARTKVTAQCLARSSKVEAELIEVGCAPNPDPNIGMRGAECQALRATHARLARCTNVPFDLRAALEREVVVLLAAAQGADAASLPVVDAECRRSREKLFGIAQQAGCPP